MKPPKNVWYVGAHSAELKSEPLARTVLGQKLVFFRRESGEPAALIDKCSHRLVPLSLGRVVGEHLQCGYHGAQFDADGNCKTDVKPGVDPTSCSVRAFPVIERHGFVWVWPGDASKADNGESIAPFIGLASEDNADVQDGGFMSLQAPFELVVDNLMDGTHAQYVHETTLGTPGLQAVRDDNEQEYKVDVGEKHVNFEIDLKNAEAGRCFHEGLALKHDMEYYNKPVDWHLKVQWQPPCFHIFSATTKPAGAPDSEGMTMHTLHAITPETSSTSNYFFKQVEIVEPGQKSYNDFWTKSTFQAFGEDKEFLEKQQLALKGSKSATQSTGWTMFLSDELSMAARSIIERVANEEMENA